MSPKVFFSLVPPQELVLKGAKPKKAKKAGLPSLLGLTCLRLDLAYRL